MSQGMHLIIFWTLRQAVLQTISVDALEGAKSSLYKGDELIDESSLEAYDMPGLD